MKAVAECERKQRALRLEDIYRVEYTEVSPLVTQSLGSIVLQLSRARLLFTRTQSMVPQQAQAEKLTPIVADKLKENVSTFIELNKV